MASFLESNGPWDQLIAAGNIELRPVDRLIHISSQLQATAFPVPHRDEYSETVGWRVQGPRKSLLYVPDTDSWDGWEWPIEYHLANVDVALLDATFFSRDELPNRDQAAVTHPTVVESLRRFVTLEDAERAKIRFTHLNHTNPLLRTDSDEYIQVIRSGMRVAAEGDTFELG
jgi:pyrroloquinoline quinone biosynthesis protein B